MDQIERNKVITAFKKKDVSTLVATDVAGNLIFVLSLRKYIYIFSFMIMIIIKLFYLSSWFGHSTYKDSGEL